MESFEKHQAKNIYIFSQAIMVYILHNRWIRLQKQW